ncbi:hypothetical protein ACFWXH_30245 [Mesorhizobium sp. NPDC059054]|uniref:hypothetical protein n=1 Tax=Mesorhizobium sp. NPDC059054 TaxID=3346711 RepID=UPI00367A36D9
MAVPITAPTPTPIAIPSAMVPIFVCHHVLFAGKASNNRVAKLVSRQRWRLRPPKCALI